jgi:TetR/AcrR family transcriptional repressor of nem operon
MGRSSNTREKLLDAIGQLVWAGSYGATTIDDICHKAGVNKGSFYHFFPSKADLVEAAIDADWQVRRAELDGIFSPLVPPLERFKKLGEYLYRAQKDAAERFGCVLGCPLFALGAEISTQETKLQRKIQEVLDHKRVYFESAIRDAHAAGLIHAPDTCAKARLLFTYYQGLLTEARIRNDLEILREAFKGTLQLLGAGPKRSEK